MRIALYDPYLDTIGGGERYVATIAEYLSKNHKVDLLWDDPGIKEKIEKTFNLDLERVNIVPNLFSQFSLIKRLLLLKNYDRLFFTSDGSIPFVDSKKNFLHFQFPTPWIKNQTIKEYIKLRNFSSVICNSHFTKTHIDKTFSIQSTVIYPPVDIRKFKPLTKEKIILSVARFTTTLHSKKQEMLVKTFKKLFDQGVRDWQFILAGGVSVEEKQLVEKLEQEIGNYPIKIISNVSFENLITLYGKASLFWHAAGFGIDEEKEPEKVEHFGITTVEAMSAGCVPVVIKRGGQKEIIEEGSSGFFFESEEELIAKTRKLIEDKNIFLKASQGARERSKFFSKENFCKRIGSVMIP